jgi:hypothetical protein
LIIVYNIGLVKLDAVNISYRVILGAPETVLISRTPGNQSGRFPPATGAFRRLPAPLMKITCLEILHWLLPLLSCSPSLRHTPPQKLGLPVSEDFELAFKVVAPGNYELALDGLELKSD